MNCRNALLPGLAALALSCSDPPEESAVSRGRALFSSPRLSTSSSNVFSCTTCHDSVSDSSAWQRKPGAPLAGATLRPTYWGNQQADLLSAINDCLRYFMLTAKPLTPNDREAEALYAYLESLEPGNPEPIPFTVVRGVEPIPRVPADGGEQLYGIACGYCHGTAKTGSGRLTVDAPILPDETIAEHPDYSPRSMRLVFIEKTRHGVFLNYGGSMPPFSLEALSDAELSAILEFLQVTGE